jgi:hypothetical protein
METIHTDESIAYNSSTETNIINEKWCKEIYENALTDPSLFSSIDIESLLSKIENEDNNYLEHKTLAIITNDIFDAITELNIENELAKNFCDRLSGYRYVERVCDLRNGKMMRWIKKSSETEFKKLSLTNGGILMNIKIENSGILLLCRNNANRFFYIKFDDCLVFQKMTMEEQLIVMSYDYMEKNDV